MKMLFSASRFAEIFGGDNKGTNDKLDCKCHVLIAEKFGNATWIDESEHQIAMFSIILTMTYVTLTIMFCIVAPMLLSMKLWVTDISLPNFLSTRSVLQMSSEIIFWSIFCSIQIECRNRRLYITMICPLLT